MGRDEIEVEGNRPEELYAAFRKKVELFITVCKGLNEKSSYGSRSERRGEEGRAGVEYDRSGNCLEQLLLRLDMSGHYSRKA